jgi:sodium-dependent phosphate transporter
MMLAGRLARHPPSVTLTPDPFPPQIAAIFEFVGALALGRVSTGVIQGGIANLSTFQREPAVYAYGMVCAMAVGGVWQGIASYCELNVSATHSISEPLAAASSVASLPARSGPSCFEPAPPPHPPTHPPTPFNNAVGAILGFSLVYGGKDAVNWATPDPKKFPPYNGAVPIFCAWVFAPIATAIAAALTLWLLRTFVLRRPNPAKLSMFVLPLSVFLTTWICIYFVFTKVCRARFCGCSCSRPGMRLAGFGECYHQCSLLP